MGTDPRTPTSREIVPTTEHKTELLSPRNLGPKCLRLRFSTKQRILESTGIVETLRTVACKFWET